jgi:nucleoside-diphosphate-sugar epimerase
VVLRIFNPIGPDVPAENLLGRAAAGLRAALHEDHDVVTFGSLEPARDFVDVRDVATAVAAAALADEVDEPVLNVGSGVATRARRAVALLADVAGYRGRIEETAPAPTRSASVDWIAADVSRIRRSLGWSPAHDLEASVKAVWAGLAGAGAGSHNGSPNGFTRRNV